MKKSFLTIVDNTASFMLTNKYYVHGQFQHGNLTATGVQEISYSEPDNFCSDSVGGLGHPIWSFDLTESCYQLFPMQNTCLKGHALKTNGDVGSAVK
jgi:hypothetical protein